MGTSHLEFEGFSISTPIPIIKPPSCSQQPNQHLWPTLPLLANQPHNKPLITTTVAKDAFQCELTNPDQTYYLTNSPSPKLDCMSLPTCVAQSNPNQVLPFIFTVVQSHPRLQSQAVDWTLHCLTTLKQWKWRMRGSYGKETEWEEMFFFFGN